MEKKLRCAIYIRVSTEEQHLNGLSLPAQKAALLEYAGKYGYQVAGIYADEGISARKAMKHRKGLIRLLEDVKQDKIDMILVTKLDRWFRNIKDYNITEEILQAHNCHWKTIFENYDSSTANGQMVINIMLSVNQAECDRTSERIKAVFDYKRSIGEVTSGMCAPFGYKVVNNRIQKDPAVSDIVDEAFRYYFTCFSRKRTIIHIQDLFGSRAPSSEIIDRFFQNEKYSGRWKGQENYCDPYISPAEFDRIKKITQSKLRPITEYTYIFSSLIRCPICGRWFTGVLKKQKLKSGGISMYPRYLCSPRYDRHPSACISESVVEKYMVDHIFCGIRDLTLQISVREKSQQRHPTVSLKRLEEELQRLNVMFQKGRITEEFYDQEYTRLEEEIRRQTAVPYAEMKKRHAELSETFCAGWQDIYYRLDNERKRAFWKSTISEINVDPVTHKLCGFKFLI